MIAALTLALSLMSGLVADEPTSALPPKPFLHSLFTDHAVLQRDVPLPVWGWTEPGARVKVAILGQSVETTADETGHWMVKLGPYPAGGPHTMTVTGPQTVEIKDLLMGDIWICSGQSNMEWSVASSDRKEEEIAAADHPNIRLFTVPKLTSVKPLATVDAQWEICSPSTIPRFTAVGYFFGRDVEKELQVPIGLINSSWGGTIAEAWISAGSVAKIGGFDKALAKIEESLETSGRKPVKFDQLLASWWKEVDPGVAGQTPWSDESFDTTDWKSMDLPGLWEGRGLADFDGIVWFRREVTLPEAWEGKPIQLSLGAVDDFDITYLNGKAIGHSEDWNAARKYKVPAGLARAGRNIVNVRVYDRQGDGGFRGASSEMKLTLADDPDAEPISLAGPWSYKIGANFADISIPPDRDDGNPNRVTVLYNGMIAPLEPLAIKGALWYQGESNAEQAAAYRRILPGLIRDWRSKFGVGDFPFFIVQLANYKKRLEQPAESSWAELREAQFLTSKAVPNAQVALAIDIGEANDIHPTNKQEVGRRLALDALATTYGKSIEYSGPTYRGMEIHTNSIRLSFDHADGGLVVQGGGKLEGFAIASKDGKFEWADAVVDGDGVVVSSTLVDLPVAVRYAWADNPACNLVNQAGLPAVPFRTDPPQPEQ